MKQSKSRAIQDMAEEGKTRVLGKRVYFEKMLETGGCSGLRGDCLSVNKGIMKSLL